MKKSIFNVFEWFKIKIDRSRSNTIPIAAIWFSAGIIGIVAVIYAKMISYFQNLFFSIFKSSPLVCSVVSPFLFILATWIVKFFAPDAKGSGIPQVISAISVSPLNQKDGNTQWHSSLVSLKTAGIKVLSSCLGILGGASIGREGPTVQISASGFAWIGNKLRRYSDSIDFQTFLVAGSAAGVAAAFNTPIAGITFAIEELGGGAMSVLRQMVMLSIIVSGIFAQGLGGNYLYFGHPSFIKLGVAQMTLEAISIGIIGGLLGGVFAKILAQPTIVNLPKHWLMRSFVAGVGCAVIGYYMHGETSGSGYEVTSHILNNGNLNEVYVFYPFLKIITTILSYLSGMAGGIFSPSLSIGAGIGLSIAKLFGLINFRACALFGMVAFFSGAVRAPLTAVIIVMEMTDEHLLVMPFMIAAFTAFSIGKLIMKEPLYHYLAKKNFEG